MNRLICIFCSLIIGMLSIFSSADEGKQPDNNPQTTPIKVYKRLPTKPQNKHMPGTAVILECEIDNNQIVFHPSFWGEGMSVRISDDSGTEWSDFVTIEEPTMFFDGQTGTFEIECLTLDGFTYFGFFEL